MAVSKRLRYEVLRRDNHTCKYCGGTAPDVTLTVDHVVPSTLGGSDDPSNLVAACMDCNAGKSASNPDAPLVADVDEKATQWALAMNRVIEQRQAEQAARRAQVDRFDQYWCSITDQRHNTPYPREEGWRASIHRFLDYGLSEAALVNAVDIAVGKTSVRARDLWRYFCGVCHRELKDIQDATSAASAGSPTAGKSYINEDGFDEGAFPEFEVVCEYLEHLVRALGGDDRVVKFVDMTVGNALSKAATDWTGGIIDSEDSTAQIRASVREAAAGDMEQIRQWRRVNRPGPTEQLDVMNLADTFLGKVLEAFTVTAEDRATVHSAYWSAMQHAHKTFIENDPPSGTDLREWVELDMEIEAETALGQVGQRRAQQVSVALAGYYVQRVLELVAAHPRVIDEARSSTPLVLENGVTEFGEACKRHLDISDHDALAAAHSVMDEWITTDVEPRMTQQGAIR